MSQQGLRQASVRAVSGTTLTYEGDWHAMWDAQSIAAGTFNERMIRYANTKLSATYTNINDAMQALAVAAGATNFGSIGTYSFALGPVPVNSVAPTLSPTTGSVGQLVTCGQGTWSNTPTSYAYQWMRGGVDRSGETASTYTTVAGDDGTTITCKVRASNANGPAAGYTTTSNSCAVSSASLILDSYTKGAVYSMRKLVSAYAGNCVRIRSSGDNAESNFGFSSNVVDAAGIAAFIVTHGGSPFVVTWYDQSGNGLDVTQATAAAQPAFIASGIGSKPVARFDNSNDILARASVANTTVGGANQYTFFSAMTQLGSASQGTLYAIEGGTQRVACHATYADQFYVDYGDPNAAAGRYSHAQPSGWDDNPHVLEHFRTTAGGYSILDNGTSFGAQGPGALSTTLTGDVGVLSIGGGYTFFHGGDIGEIFFLKTDVGSSPRATIRADMGAFYGITVV